jgi:hypothetical protein
MNREHHTILSRSTKSARGQTVTGEMLPLQTDTNAFESLAMNLVGDSCGLFNPNPISSDTIPVIGTFRTISAVWTVGSTGSVSDQEDLEYNVDSFASRGRTQSILNPASYENMNILNIFEWFLGNAWWRS